MSARPPRNANATVTALIARVSRRARISSVVGALFATTVLLAACGKGGGGTTAAAGTNGLKTGPGVTNRSITLGVLSVLSGPYAALGTPVLQAARLYFDQVNANGGICGRQVKLSVGDDGADPTKAQSLYTQMAPNVLGMAQLVGAAVNAALAPQVESDKMFTFPSSNAPALLANPDNLIIGTTYSLEMINGVAWLVADKGLKRGDAIGMIYGQGDPGGLYRGTAYAAQRLGLKLTGEQVTPTETDMSSQVAALKNQHVRAILLDTTTGQTSSVASATASLGLNVPLVGYDATFVPQLLSTSVGRVLERNFYMVTPVAPFSADAPAVKRLREAYAKTYPSTPGQLLVDYSYAAAEAYGAVLKRACVEKDLSRAGVLKAFRETRSFNSNGLEPTLDFSHANTPPTRATRILKADAKAVGGLTVVSPLAASSIAQTYTGSRS